MDGIKKKFFFLNLNKLFCLKLRFFTYGSFPLSDTLEFLNNYLNQYEKTKLLSSSLIEEPRWNKSRSVKIACSPQSFVVDPNKTTTVSISYLLGR
jgi:Zn-dependent M16 (insulinase) family peptidase